MKKSIIELRHTINSEYYHTTPKGIKCKVYVCNCLNEGCINEVKIWSNTSRHDGLCELCADAGNRREPYTYLYNSFLNGQRHRGISVKMSFKEFQHLCEIKECHYCGNSTIRDKHRQKKQSNAYMLDRKDNSLPYTVDNCVSCCWYCNNLKSNRFTHDEFLKLRSFIKKEFGR
jgi:5-methylcytosine-specific restriction endonuclease McrA